MHRQTLCVIMATLASANSFAQSADQPDCDPAHLKYFSENHPDRKRCEAAKKGPYSGNWVKKDGELICDGYLSRRADQDYCVAIVPADWKLIEFNGKKYYVQPLS